MCGISNDPSGTEDDTSFNDDHSSIENECQSFNNEDKELYEFEDEQNFIGNCIVWLNCNTCFILIFLTFEYNKVFFIGLCSFFPLSFV